MSKQAKNWLKCAGVRAIRTFAQTLTPLIPLSMGIEEINWLHIISVSIVSGILSIVTSLSGLPECEEKEEINGN